MGYFGHPEVMPTPPPGGEIPPEDFRIKFHQLEHDLRDVSRRLMFAHGAHHLIVDQALGHSYLPEPLDAATAERIIPEMENVLQNAKDELKKLEHPTVH